MTWQRSEPADPDGSPQSGGGRARPSPDETVDVLLVLSGPGECDVEFRDLPPQHTRLGLSPSGDVTSGEKILTERLVRQFGRPDDFAKSGHLGPQVVEALVGHGRSVPLARHVDGKH